MSEYMKFMRTFSAAPDTIKAFVWAAICVSDEDFLDNFALSVCCWIWDSSRFIEEVDNFREAFRRLDRSSEDLLW